MNPEVWLRGPVDGVRAELMPVAHALLQAREDLEHHVADVGDGEVWVEPGGAASMGFHIRHTGGSIQRLLTYARGEGLSEAQLRAIARETAPGDPPATAADLLTEALASIGEALEMVRTVPAEELFADRFVGRAQLPSTTFGLLFHIGEHTTRHVGQLITTKKIVRGLDFADLTHPKLTVGNVRRDDVCKGWMVNVRRLPKRLVDSSRPALIQT